MDHFIGEDTLDGSFCYWNHDGEPSNVQEVQKSENNNGSKLVDDSEFQAPRRSELQDIQEVVRTQESWQSWIVATQISIIRDAVIWM